MWNHVHDCTWHCKLTWVQIWSWDEESSKRLPSRVKKNVFWESLNPSNFFGFWRWVSGWVVEKCGDELKPPKTRFSDTAEPTSTLLQYQIPSNWTLLQYHVPRYRTKPTEEKNARRFSNEFTFWAWGYPQGRLRCAGNLVFDGFRLPPHFVTTHPLTHLQKPKKVRRN